MIFVISASKYVSIRRSKEKGCHTFSELHPNPLINSCKFYNVTDEDIVECIKKLLRLDHLNEDEYEHVKKLIKNSAERFEIPGEPL